jgi:alpha-D-ribose 1-methylphosphonate 5-triphosphate synthase subunit PhnH
MMQQPDLGGGFTEPVFGAQAVFRALMDALANPGRPRPLAAGLAAPAELPPGLAAVALTLCDHDTPLWLDAELAASDAVLAWLRFHTAAPIVTAPAAAHFALATRAVLLPPLARFAPGTDDYPDRSTTIVLALPALRGGPALVLRGPGIAGEIRIAPQGLPADFVAQWTANRAHFPRGIDLLLVAGTEVLGLPRTTRIAPEAN